MPAHCLNCSVLIFGSGVRVLIIVASWLFSLFVIKFSYAFHLVHSVHPVRLRHSQCCCFFFSPCSHFCSSHFVSCFSFITRHSLSKYTLDWTIYPIEQCARCKLNSEHRTPTEDAITDLNCRRQRSILLHNVTQSITNSCWRFVFLFSSSLIPCSPLRFRSIFSGFGCFGFYGIRFHFLLFLSAHFSFRFFHFDVYDSIVPECSLMFVARICLRYPSRLHFCYRFQS